MKLKYFGLLMVLSLFITACVQSGEALMGPVSYEKSIRVHSNKNAYLVWQHGQDVAAVSHTEPGEDAGVLGALITRAIDDAQHKNTPGRFTYQYGKPQQTVFMTSLRDTLKQQHAFKKVVLVTSAPKLGANDVAIYVNFKQTRVNRGVYDRNEIVVDAQLNVNDPTHRAFKKNYVVASTQPEKLFETKTFTDHQSEVSKKLMAKVIRGLEQWSRQA